MDTANVPIACRVTKINLARVSRGSYRPGTQFAPGVPLQNHLTRLRDHYKFINMNITYRFRDCAKLFRRPTFFNELFYTPSIECFHSRGLHLCKCFGTKEIICIRKEFISNGTGLGHQHGRRFIVLGHQYGRRDVM